MTIIQDDPPVLQGVQGEVITVRVRSAGTVHLVTFVLNGQLVPPQEQSPNESVLRFTLDKNIANPFDLKISFSYSQDSGGSYTITTTGSAGGDTHRKTCKQNGVPADGKMYLFPIV